MDEDLWPANIVDSKLVPPVSIMKAQAAVLGEKTRQLVRGEVSTEVTGNMIMQRFWIVAPTIAYKYELFSASHTVNFYPLTIRHLNDTVQVMDEAEFKEKLKAILAEGHTVNVVHSILAQVRS